MRNDATIMRTRLCIHPVVGELAHARVDDRVAGASLLPRLEPVLAVLPGEVAQAGQEGARLDVGAVPQNVDVELAPDELAQEGCCGRVAVVERARPRARAPRWPAPS